MGGVPHPVALLSAMGWMAHIISAWGLLGKTDIVVASAAVLGYNQAKSRGHGCTMGIDFEWNPNKVTRNLRKHGVTFEEAATVFRDDLGITVPDPDHSMEEDRFITVGLSSQDRLLMIAHAERGDCIRIISARELTPRERRQYEEAD
jgi:uncharacterized protein